VGSEAQKTCNISERVQNTTKVRAYHDGLIGSRIRAFDWRQNQWPWMTLNVRNVILGVIKSIYGAQQKNLN